MYDADDPEVPHTQQFRNFLKEHVVFKEVNITYVLFSFSEEHLEGCMTQFGTQFSNLPSSICNQIL